MDMGWGCGGEKKKLTEIVNSLVKFHLYKSFKFKNEKIKTNILSKAI